jgi:parvulin-like peptidyl-prolyl isomerase
VRTSVLRTLTALVLAGLLVACGGSVGGSVAASVDGEEIERELLERMVRAQLESQGTDPESLEGEEREQAVTPIQRQILTALIQFEILAQLADDLDIEVDDDDLDEMYEEQVQQFGGEEAYQEATGLDEEEFRDLVVATEVRVDKILDSLSDDVDEEELREFYDAQVESRYATRTARHILVDDEDEADDLVDELDDGADFGELAEEFSQDPGSAAEEGQLPPAPRGQYVPEFDEAVWESDLEEVVGPIETEFGFHIIEVIDEDVAEFEDVRDELEEELSGGEVQGAFQAMVQQAFAESDVEVDSAYGRWDPSTGTVVGEDQEQQEMVPEPGPEGDMPEGEMLPEGEIPDELMEELEEQLEQQEQLDDEGGEPDDGE